MVDVWIPRCGLIEWIRFARGEVDGIFSGPRTSERERMCSFSDEPLIQNQWVLFVRTADVGAMPCSFDRR